MTRTAWTALAGLLLASVLAAVCLAPARGTTSRGYQAVQPQMFTPLPALWPPETPTSATLAPKPSHNAVPAPTARPRPSPTRAYRSGIGTAVGAVKGTATFFPAPTGTAAAGKRLRDAMGPNWRHRYVRVCLEARCIVVFLDDYEASTIPGRTIDLSEGSFAALVGPGWYQRGVAEVVVSWGN